MSSQGRQIVPTYFFFNNDLEYLRGGSNDKKYTDSMTKSKDARYELKGIEYMVPNLWSLHDVYPTKRVLSIISVKVVEWYQYGHLEENVVKRADQKLYTFKEGNFKRLHLNDIEDMLLLVVQNKLHNLDMNVVVYLVVNLLRDTLDQMLHELHLGYNTTMRRRLWTRLDQQRTRIMIKAINQKLLDRRIMRSLEKFVGGRDYGEGRKLLQWTI
ncbi:hypothetical protein Tco_0668209 [Tanacetum coccineum]